MQGLGALTSVLGGVRVHLRGGTDDQGGGGADNESHLAYEFCVLRSDAMEDSATDGKPERAKDGGETLFRPGGFFFVTAPLW